MNGFNAYFLIIAASLIIILSYFISLLSRRTSIPGVLMLLLVGILLKVTLIATHHPDLNLYPMLEVLGIVGLIMIVLEAALDLELSREKIGLIIRSFLMAIVSLFITSFAIAAVFTKLLDTDFVNSLIYAIPLSIMSSAIVIPSVTHLEKSRKEFMIYESTFSDILGIMFFYLLIGNTEATSNGSVVTSVLLNIVLTIVVSAVASYGLVYVFHRLKSDIRLFLLIAVLILLYALGKMLHLSSLLIILSFGLIMRNQDIFIFGKMKKIISNDALGEVYNQLRLVTIETSFVVRTFFFVIFGMTITLASLVHWQVIVVSLLVAILVYVIRLGLLKVILKKNFAVEFFMAPRGLITILLFFNIPPDYQVAEFDGSKLFLIIILTSLMMAYGLIKFRKQNNSSDVLNDEVEEEPAGIIEQTDSSTNIK